MKSLYLRIWLTVVAALALFALVSGLMWQRHLDEERARVEQSINERLAAWAELVQRSLPPADAALDQQAEALREWSARLRVPLALDDPLGQRIAASDSYLRRLAEGNGRINAASVRLDDGRMLWLARRQPRRPPVDGPPASAWVIWPRGGAGSAPAEADRRDARPPRDEVDALRRRPPEAPAEAEGAGPLPPLFFGLPRAVGPLVLVAMLFVAVAAGAYPVVRRLTRRLESLKQGVAAFGQGELAHRVDESGKDEVAEVAATFNRTAQRIETLIQSHKSLLANASHELRSPLARLKMAVAMLDGLPNQPPGDQTLAQRQALLREVDTNIAELDALVEEVLLASRLDASNQPIDRQEKVDLVGLAAEEAARVEAELEVLGPAPLAAVLGSERLLRRALRNLLENARRYGGDQVQVTLAAQPPGRVHIRVSDRGPGVPQSFRERIFEPYFRLPGHAEREGGVGLGLSLVRQIAKAHGGQVHCEPREGGGTVFVINLPAA